MKKQNALLNLGYQAVRDVLIIGKDGCEKEAVAKALAFFPQAVRRAIRIIKIWETASLAPCGSAMDWAHFHKDRSICIFVDRANNLGVHYYTELLGCHCGVADVCALAIWHEAGHVHSHLSTHLNKERWVEIAGGFEAYSDDVSNYREKGFVTPWSMKNGEEDRAEFIKAVMLFFATAGKINIFFGVQKVIALSKLCWLSDNGFLYPKDREIIKSVIAS